MSIQKSDGEDDDDDDIDEYPALKFSNVGQSHTLEKLLDQLITIQWTTQIIVD